MLSTDRGQSWSFEHDRLVLLEQPFFPSPQPSGGGCARRLPLCLLSFVAALSDAGVCVHADGNTVESADGSLVSVGSWRDPSGAIHCEAVRWRLP